MNKPQTEGRVNHVCTEEHRGRFNTLQQLKTKQRSTIVSLSKVIVLISMIEPDQRSEANTSVNKIRLYIFVLFNI